MARNDAAKKEVQDAAAVLARFIAGILWERTNAIVLEPTPLKRDSTEIRAVSRGEAAERIDLSVKSVDRLIENGTFRPLPKTGRSIRIPINQIEDYLKQRE